MKKIKNLFFAALMALTMTVILQVPTQAKSQGMSYTYTADSITISWQAPSTNNTIDYYRIYDETTNTWLADHLDPSKLSWTKKGLSKGYISRWSVYYSYTNPQNNWSYEKATVGDLYVNTTPATLSTGSIGLYYVDSNDAPNTTTVGFSAKTPSSFSTELELYKGTKKVKVLYFDTYSDKISITKNTAYKYRVRIYYTNSDTQKKCPGAWSGYRYVDSPKGKCTYNNKTRGCKLTFYKVSGIKNYSVYVSTSQTSGFKKTATVTVTKKSKTVAIKKIGKAAMKKGKAYYLRIVPNFTVGKKTVSSDIPLTYHFTNRK